MRCVALCTLGTLNTLGGHMGYCADQKRTHFVLEMHCLKHSEQRPDCPLGERENYLEFHGKYMGSNLYRITYSSPCAVRLKMTEE